MRSKANFKGHPIHPALIPFPLAFLFGAFIFDIIGAIDENEIYWRMGGYLAIAGVIAGFIAAVPGIIDYLYTVPPNSSGKERAIKHGLVNTSALILFIVAISIHENRVFDVLVLGIEALGVGCLTVGGWLGGTLVYRNQIGVDPRYAFAGKWKEDRITGDLTQKVLVAKRDELNVNQMKLLHVDGRRVILSRTEKSYVAFDDRCTHKGGSLAGGAMICGTVQCPWHGSQFEVHTGIVKAGPASEGIAIYTVEELGADVYITL